MSLLNGNALVTGAGKQSPQNNGERRLTSRSGSGIGRQLSLAYARAGAKGITLADMDKQGIAETERLIHTEFPDVKILSVIIDVTDETSVISMVDQAVAEFGTLDYGERQNPLRYRALPRIDEYARADNFCLSRKCCRCHREDSREVCKCSDQ